MLKKTLKDENNQIEIEQLTEGDWVDIRLTFKADGISGVLDCQLQESELTSLREVLISIKDRKSSEFKSLEGNLFLKIDRTAIGAVKIICSLMHQNGDTKVYFIIHSDLSYFS